MAVYCRRPDPFSVEEAHYILTHPDFEKIITDPPCKPCASDVYLYSFEGLPFRKNDWRCDQYTWINCGVRLLPRKDPKVKKFYHKAKHTGSGNFIRHCYMLVCSPSELVLLHYMGDGSQIQQLPHGNRRKHLERIHVRTMPSVLQKISNARDKPSKIYQDLCNEPLSKPAYIPVAQPRNLEQVRNKLKAERKHKRISHDDLYSVYELCELLEGFTHELSLYPTVILVMGLSEILTEVKKIIPVETDMPKLFSYDTTFQLGDFYLSTLLFKNIIFHESPLIPVMFMIHDSRKETSHKRFFECVLQLCPVFNSENVVVVTDRERAILNAMEFVLPRSFTVICWNHIRGDVTFWLKKHGANSAETKVYISNIWTLLLSSSQQDYIFKLKEISIKWSQAFLDYFMEELHETISYHAGSWILKKLNIFNEGSGITTNISESFHAALKRLSEWKEMTMEAMVLSLYAMQNFYWRETLRGLCNTGNLHLHLQFSKNARTPENTVFPNIACDPSQIMDLVKQGKLPNPQIKKSFEKSPSVCQEVLADNIVKNNLIALCPQLGVFVVKGTKDQNYVVRLFPKENCSCPSTRMCYHILAAKKSVSLPPVPIRPRKIQLTQLKRNRRQKKRSGRKFPRAQENITVVPAADSVALTDDSYFLKIGDLFTTRDVENTQPLMTSTPKCALKTQSAVGVLSEGITAFPSCMKMRYGNDCISAPWHGCTFSKLDKIDQGLLGSVANICIYDYDIETLEGHNWLNDHIIDGFLASRAIMAKELGHDGTVFPLSCYFFETLVSGRLSPGVYKYFLKYGVLRKDVLLIPVNDSKVHWILIVIVFKRKTILYLDSNHGLKLSILKVITSFFGQLYEQISKKPYTFKDWSFFAPNDVPKQENSSDCGPFVCAFSHLIASGNKHQFTQKDMCSIRPWIAKEILGYCGKSYLEKEENYIPLEIGDDLPGKQPVSQEPEIYVSTSCPPGFEDTLTYCSDILPSLFEGRWSQCFLKDNCRRPIEDVTMVFCDGNCKDWYHCCCLGIDPKDLPSVFICQRCKSESDK